MATRDHLLKFQTASPFRPFIVRMAAGSEFTVEDPDMVSCAPAGLAMSVYAADGTHLLDMRLVVEMRPAAGPASARRNGGRRRAPSGPSHAGTARGAVATPLDADLPAGAPLHCPICGSYAQGDFLVYAAVWVHTDTLDQAEDIAVDLPSDASTVECRARVRRAPGVMAPCRHRLSLGEFRRAYKAHPPRAWRRDPDVM